MSKRLILAVAVVGLLYWQFGKKKNPEPEVIEGDQTPPIIGNSPRWLTDEEARRYLAAYEDLRMAYGSDLEQAKLHYQNRGFKENRTF